MTTELNLIGPHRHQFTRLDKPTGIPLRVCSLCGTKQVKLSGCWKPITTWIDDANAHHRPR